MRNFNGQNERLKRNYIIFLKETKGQDHTSLDKVAAALVKFEESTKYKPLSKFHIEQARQFKKTLARAKNPNTGNPLSLTTIDATVFQDGREVDTKNSKVFTTSIFPVNPAYLACFTAWVKHLQDTRLFGPEDALFPKPERELINGKFAFSKVSRAPYANPSKLNQIVRQAFANVQLPEYTPHSFRNTLTLLMSDLNLSMEEQKAWSQNLGHKDFATTISHYLKVPEQRQIELIAGLKG